MNGRIEQIPEGSLIFIQGKFPGDIVILQEGTVEMLSAPEEYSGLDKEILLSRSSRILVSSQPGIILGHSSMLSGQCTKTVRALTDCTVVRYKLSSEGIREMAQTMPEDTAILLMNMISRIKSSSATDTRYSRMYQWSCAFADNLAIMYKELNGRGAPEELDSRAESMYRNFTASNGQFPEFFRGNFLISDNSRYLSRRYTLPGESASDALQNNNVQFINEILNLSRKTIASIISENPQIAVSVTDSMCSIYDDILYRFESAHSLMIRELGTVFNEQGSWTEYLTSLDGYDILKNSGRLAPEFIKDLITIITKLNQLYEDLTGKNLSSVFPGIRTMHDFFQPGKKEPKTETEEKHSSTEEHASAGTAPVADLNDSLHTILNFALADREFQIKFIKLLDEFKSSPTPFETDSDSRRLRSQITKLYWELYKQVFIRSRAVKNVPKAARLMLNFGFLDETMLDPEQLQELNQLILTREPRPTMAVVRDPEFLSLIYEGKERPSITEMGLTYEAFIREESKHKSTKTINENEPDENTNHFLYEVDHRVTETAAVCSGSKSTAFPILTNRLIKGSLTDHLCRKNMVETIVKKIRNIDFSLFYRETVFKITEEAREIIKEEVTPYFILVPVVGSRTLLWQELSGTNKRSRSRIIIPIFFMGDLEKSLAHTLACFRWELNRSIKGAMWADPIEGGITGEYFDYVNTFKKNSKLSSDAKEKLVERFKSLRTNRDRFAEDYLMWIFYEKDGIMKLNSVVREMFYKHVPFSKNIRDQLINMPAFSHAATRYRNIQNRDIQAYERKYKKYMDVKTGKYPDEIEKFMKFLRS